jgi:uncharacterized protein (DUF302 family)
MSYYFSKVVALPFEEAIQKAVAALKTEDFDVLNEIDVKMTLKKKLGVDFRNYLILGACNPPFAYKALQAERMIGTMLPCNIVVQETMDGQTEVTAINPMESMQAVGNENLIEVAREVQNKLKNVIALI